MPRKDFAAFTRLDASDVNTYLMDQAVQTFAGTAARGSAITTPVEGMVTYLEDLDRYDTYNGSSHVPMGGLTLVKTQTIGSAVATVTVSNAFSSDYDNYKIIVTGGSASGAANLTLKFGASTTGYRAGVAQITFNGATQAIITDNDAASFTFVGTMNATLKTLNVDVLEPNIDRETRIMGSLVRGLSAGALVGFHTNTDTHTDFTIGTTSGTMTGGTIFVYGYKKA
jgi:hypothetical protein